MAPTNRLPWVNYAEFTGLFLVQGAATAMWFVPLTSVLEASGLEAIRPLAYATSAVAAFVSPLFFGAMADRHLAPAVVFRWLALASAVVMALAACTIQQGGPPWLVLGVILVYSLCSAPAWSLASTIVLGGLRDALREFGPIRAAGTLGWMTGCWVISALDADASPRAGYAGAVAWLAVAGLTLLLPRRRPPPSVAATSLRERFGLDALGLLRHPDHRAVFLTVALFNIPLAAFYPFTPPHLRELGLIHPTAWMSLGQVTEILAMLALARVMSRWRLKWIIASGLALGILRFALCALGTRTAVLLGVGLHGASFTFVFITAQIYLNARIDPAWRARAQALMSLMVGGIGNLVGYLGTGWWFARTAAPGGQDWPAFWFALSAASAVIFTAFVFAYRGKGPVEGS